MPLNEQSMTVDEAREILADLDKLEKKCEGMTSWESEEEERLIERVTKTKRLAESVLWEMERRQMDAI